ncbi:DUF5712 family protein [Plebeiibacterium marinum]|uniref:DUF5712 family protein n=1 Tax=Plebeiibacterium marinum TaxID=2992111 RepID=A0AAE3MD51_9BACT|nr:DUF5712 family protein [Plebeiobacterium marinum]MCW3805743.1 DUF5712 family protein [Plebeiobacterium marinum]
MYIKIINPSIHGKTTYSNTGSCKSLADYLSKENEKHPLDKREMFFNHIDDELSSNAVISMIDNNTKRNAKNRTKFHSLVIAPDEHELKHINHSPLKFKQYACEVMQQYAASFNLKDGKKLGIDNLVWAGKLEYERNGEYNNGNNMHVHIIVSARDKEQKIALSPNTNDKSRFKRVDFYLESEKAFDKIFNYHRVESKLKTDQVWKYASLEEKEAYFDDLDNMRSQSVDKSISHQVEQLTSNLSLSTSSSNASAYKEEDKFKKKKKVKKLKPKI